MRHGWIDYYTDMVSAQSTIMNNDDGLETRTTAYQRYQSATHISKTPTNLKKIIPSHISCSYTQHLNFAETYKEKNIHTILTFLFQESYMYYVSFWPRVGEQGFSHRIIGKFSLPPARDFYQDSQSAIVTNPSTCQRLLLGFLVSNCY